MKTIWKYTLRIDDHQMLQLPLGAKILSVGLEPKILVDSNVMHGIFDSGIEAADAVCVWAEVETDEVAIAQCSVWMRGTGHILTGGEDKFLGTVVDYKHGFAWYVFVDEAWL